MGASADFTGGGADDKLVLNNTASGVDNDQLSITFQIKMDSLAGDVHIWNYGYQQTAGNDSAGIFFDQPENTISFFHHTSGTQGYWQGTTNSINDTTNFHSVSLTYDRSSTANDPVIIVDRVTQSLTEVTAPTGTAESGQDSYWLGINAAGGQDLNAQVAYFEYFTGVLLNKGQTDELSFFPGKLGNLDGKRIVYLPLLSNVTDISGNGNTPTNTGVTFVDDGPPVTLWTGPAITTFDITEPAATPAISGVVGANFSGII